jgi:release factor glutamine methyltransferase
MVVDLPTTVAASLDDAARVLEAGGVPEPRREAARLAEAAWRLPSGQARLRPDGAVAAEAAHRLAELVSRRAGGEPLAHVTGMAGFRRLDLVADRRALIPRPETEGLVGLVLERIPTGVVADVCTGGGCIALSLALEGRYGRVIGVDASPDALAQARHNGAQLGLAVDWRLGHLAEPLAGERLDALVANPPYLTTAEYASLDADVRDWEPRMALESGTDGLEATRELLESGLAVVKPGGWLAFEVDSRRAADVARLAGGFGWLEPTVHQDLFDRARYVLARRSESS